MPRLIDADELMWHKSSLVEPRGKTVSMGKPISQDEVYAYRLGWNEAIDGIIENAPTVDVERHGHWDDTKVAFYLKCSECGCCVRAFVGEVFLDYSQEWNYCPNCGAKMDEE